LSAAAGHCYDVYGLTLRSEFALPLPAQPSGGADIEIETAGAEHFAAALGGRAMPDEFRAYLRLPDGASYARWMTVGEYIVSADGRRIACRRFDQATDASFHVYLLGQALSFALVKLGLEPLHATAVVIEGHAVAFLGSSHFGKSTLAASFAAAGHQLLTDDVLVLRPSAQGRMVAFPGPPRIKLYSDVARKLLPRAAAGVPMHGQVPKLILALDRNACCSSPTPIAALYILGNARDAFRGQACRIDALSTSERFVHLLANTINDSIVDGPRLQRHFKATVTFLNSIPVRRLVYRRDFRKLSEVRAVVCADVANLLSGGT
jgi:hypothetical protein